MDRPPDQNRFEADPFATPDRDLALAGTDPWGLGIAGSGSGPEINLRQPRSVSELAQWHHLIRCRAGTQYLRPGDDGLPRLGEASIPSPVRPPRCRWSRTLRPGVCAAYWIGAVRFCAIDQDDLGHDIQHRGRSAGIGGERRSRFGRARSCGSGRDPRRRIDFQDEDSDGEQDDWKARPDQFLARCSTDTTDQRRDSPGE